MQRNYQAALDKAKLQTYEISQETLEANKDYVVSGTGVSAAKKGLEAPALVAAA